MLWSGAVFLGLLFSSWCCGAIWFQCWIRSEGLKLLLLILFALISCALAAGSFCKWYLLPIQFLLSAGVAIPWLILMQPTGKRDWQDACARIPVAEFSPDGESVTIRNIRDFHYRSKTDYDIRYRTETYQLKDLRSLDYVITHWGMDRIGHVMLSFGFADGRHLVFSGETRIGKSQSKNLFAGIFRQYELIYIIGTEEDLLQLRTHHRKEQVYLYPMVVIPEFLPFIFTDLVQRAADLGPHPQFYNTLLYNCTNSLAVTSKKFGSAFGSGFSGIINGVYDRSAFYSGKLKDRREQESFAEYRQRHLINQYVSGSGDLPDYSRRIRPQAAGMKGTSKNSNECIGRRCAK